MTLEKMWLTLFCTNGQMTGFHCCLSADLQSVCESHLRLASG